MNGNLVDIHTNHVELLHCCIDIFASKLQRMWWNLHNTYCFPSTDLYCSLHHVYLWNLLQYSIGQGLQQSFNLVEIND